MKKIIEFAKKPISWIYIIVLFISMICLIFLFILLLINSIIAEEDQITELVWVGAYIFCAFLLLAFCVKDEYRKKRTGKVSEDLFLRNDTWELLILSICPSIIVSFFWGICFNLNITSIEVLTIFLMCGITILWFVYKTKKFKDDENIRKKLSKTAQNMAMFITLIGIAQTDMPSDMLKLLFVVMGFTYTIFSNMI